MVVETGIKTTTYTHAKPGTDIPFGIAGYYTPLEETRLRLKGREVLYVTGRVVMEASCCIMAEQWIYAIVPGYIVEWHDTVNDDGEPVSTVEPVRDLKEREAVRELIGAKEGMVPVDFW